jgi:hypothetical protein
MSAFSPSKLTSPASGQSSPATIRSSVVLPEPEVAQQRQQLAVGDLQVDAVERCKAAEILAQLSDFDGHGTSLSSNLRSSTVFAINVISASIASSEATANDATNWYSL